MGLRFKKSFKIAPGVKVNVGKKSSSVTFGGKGAHYTVSSSGRRTSSVDIPGTGISYVSTSGGRSKRTNPQRSASNTHSNMSSPSPNRNTNHNNKNKKASTTRMVMFYALFAVFLLITALSAMILISSFAQGFSAILLSLFFAGVNVYGLISSWKLASREKYLLSHDEPYQNKMPKLLILVFAFSIILTSFMFTGSDSDSDTAQAKKEETTQEKQVEEKAEQETDEQQAESTEEESNTATEEEQTVTEQAENTESEAVEEPVEEPVQEEQPAEQVAEQQDSNTAVESNTDVTVYITNTGSKYHTATCRTLKDSKIPISLSDAIGSYEPCGICHPPTN